MVVNRWHVASVVWRKLNFDGTLFTKFENYTKHSRGARKTKRYLQSSAISFSLSLSLSPSLLCHFWPFLDIFLGKLHRKLALLRNTLNPIGLREKKQRSWIISWRSHPAQRRCVALACFPQMSQFLYQSLAYFICFLMSLKNVFSKKVIKSTPIFCIYNVCV